jgi:2-polyprenyl-3-methyl-5-hydroxy-6-metoxy-1,4-benzoquinol methylase
MNKYKTTIDTYNKLAQAYQDRFMDLDIYNHTYDSFCNFVDVKNPKVLEIACGPGNVSRYLLKQRPDFKILGIDLAEKMIQLAKVNNPTVDYQVMDCLDINQFDQKFDAVMSGFCMPYISKDDCLKQIQYVSNLLNPNGIFYLSTMEDDPEKSGLKGSPNHDDKVYMFFHQAEYLIQALEQNGFEILDIQRQDYADTEQTETTDLFIYARKKVSS